MFAFARYLADKGIPIWIRHVVLPGMTDSDDHLHELGCFIAGLRTVKALDVLPYHKLGLEKYRRLGLEYPLPDLEPATPLQASEAKKKILDAFYACRKAQKT